MKFLTYLKTVFLTPISEAHQIIRCGLVVAAIGGTMGMVGTMPDVRAQEAPVTCPTGSDCEAYDVKDAISYPHDLGARIDRECLYHFDGDCRVIANGQLVADDHTGPIWWQHLALQPTGDAPTQMIILYDMRNPAIPGPVGFAQSSYFLIAPERIQYGDIALLHIGGVRAGSSAYQADHLFRWSDEQWDEVDLSQWIIDSEKLLPTGMELRQRVAYDFREMFARVDVSRADDGNCCATAGRLFIDLGLLGNNLVATSLEFQETNIVGDPLRIEVVRHNAELVE